MDFFVQFGLLFTNMSWIVIVCLIVGIVLLLVEIFQPGFGVFGIFGLILIAVGITLRAVFHLPEDNPLAQIFILLLLIAITILLGFGFMLLASKLGWLNRTSLVQNGTAVSTEISDGTEDYRMLVAKLGVAVTDLRPVGRIAVDGIMYDAQAESFFITKGSGIKVVEVEGGRIVVRLVD